MCVCVCVRVWSEGRGKESVAGVCGCASRRQALDGTLGYGLRNDAPRAIDMVGV